MKLNHLKISFLLCRKLKREPSSRTKGILIYFIICILLQIGSSGLSADPLANQKLLEELSNPKTEIRINSDNAGKFEAVFLPHLSELIIRYNLNLPLSGLSPENYDLKEQSAETKPQELLSEIILKLSSGYLVELDQVLDLDSANESSKTKIQSSTVRLNPILKDPNSAVRFKEKFSVLSPDWLSSMKFLTIRQADEKDDLLWYFSPNLNKSSELAGSLRGDFLFNSIVSLNDLFFFGSKTETISAVNTEESEMLIPLPDAKSVNWEKSKDSACLTFSNSSKNFSEFIKKASLYKRTVQTLELKYKDPFSSVGRQKLYIDKLTGLPVLKEDFSHMGELRRFALASYTISRIAGGSAVLAPAAVSIMDRHGKNVSILTTDGRICSELPEGFKLSRLDPSALAETD